MANIYKGAGILWGCGSTSGTLAGVGSLTLLQSSEVSGDVTKTVIADNSGNANSIVYGDHTQKASLDFVPTSGTGTGTVNVTASVSAGVTLALTDTVFVPIAGTWLVDEQPTWTAANNNALRMRVNLIKYLQNSLP